MINFIKDISSELIVGASTLSVGWLAHRRALSEMRSEALDNNEDRQQRMHESELLYIQQRQQAVQEQMLEALHHLESERDKLLMRMAKLEAKIDLLEEENTVWRERYLELLSKCQPIDDDVEI